MKKKESKIKNSPDAVVKALALCQNIREFLKKDSAGMDEDMAVMVMALSYFLLYMEKERGINPVKLMDSWANDVSGLVKSCQHAPEVQAFIN